MLEENVQAEDSNQQEEEVLETSNEESSEQEEGESVDEYKARLAKAQEIAKNYKIRAEKAERTLKDKSFNSSHKSDTAKDKDLSTEDLYALMSAKVPQDDIQEVKEYATLKGISIAEALKSNVVKTILSDNAEMRNTAQASNVGNVRRVSKQVTDEQLIQNVKSGKLPETDEDMMRYVQARRKK